MNVQRTPRNPSRKSTDVMEAMSYRGGKAKADGMGWALANGSRWRWLLEAESSFVLPQDRLKDANAPVGDVTLSYSCEPGVCDRMPQQV